MSETPDTIWAQCSAHQNWGDLNARRYKIDWWHEYRRADLPPTLSAAMELPEVKALVEAARKMLVAAELREIYHRLPNDKNRIGDPKSPKAKARDAWLKAFRRASSATSLALAAIKETKT
jgi:hypothetical protein